MRTAVTPFKLSTTDANPPCRCVQFLTATEVPGVFVRNKMRLQTPFRMTDENRVKYPDLYTFFQKLYDAIKSNHPDVRGGALRPNLNA